MDLNDLYKLAGISRDDTPAIEPQPVEQQVAEQPMDGRTDMKAMIALVTPEQLNQIVGNAPVEEEGFANSGDEYAGEPEEYKGTLGSPADLSLRRYLGANGQPVKMENVYTDHKVEDITEAWQAYKVAEGEMPAGLKAYHDKKKKKSGDKEETDESIEEGKYGKKKKYDEESVDEADVEENAFNQAAAAASRAGKDSFEFGGKTHKTTMKKDTAHKLADDVNYDIDEEAVTEGGMKQAAVEVEEWAEKYNTKTGTNGDELAHGWLQAMLNSGIMSDSYDQDEYAAFNEKYGFEDDMEWEEDSMDKFFAESPITRGMHDEANAIMKKYGIDEDNFNDILGHFESKNQSINDLRKLAGI